MKVSKQTFYRIVEDMRTVYNAASPQQKEQWAKLSEAGQAWAIYHVVGDNRQYTDNHPAFTSGTWKRVVPYDPEWEFYVDNTNDKTLETALLKALDIVKNKTEKDYVLVHTHGEGTSTYLFKSPSQIPTGWYSEENVDGDDLEKLKNVFEKLGINVEFFKEEYVDIVENDFSKIKKIFL